MVRLKILSNIINKRRNGYLYFNQTSTTPFNLTDVKINKVYSQEEKKYTDIVESITYTCVERKRCDKFNVKIDGATEPIIDNEELQKIIETDGAPLVVLENLTVLTYVSQDEERDVITIGDSFKADGIRFVNEK